MVPPDKQITLTFPVKYAPCCQFKSGKEEYANVSQLLKEKLKGNIDYHEVMVAAAVGVPSRMDPKDLKGEKAAIRRRRDVIQRAHNTSRYRCNLDATTPIGAGALDPGNNRDMCMFLLHLQHVLDTIPGSRRLLWPITFDEDTYTRARKLILYVEETLPASGLVDSMMLPDFSRMFLVPEFWHVGYVLLKHVVFGPQLVCVCACTCACVCVCVCGMCMCMFMCMCMRVYMCMCMYMHAS